MAGPTDAELGDEKLLGRGAVGGRGCWGVPLLRRGADGTRGRWGESGLALSPSNDNRGPQEVLADRNGSNSGEPSVSTVLAQPILKATAAQPRRHPGQFPPGGSAGGRQGQQRHPLAVAGLQVGIGKIGRAHV